MFSEEDIAKAIREDAEVQRGLDELAEEVKAYWAQISPTDTHIYQNSLVIRKRRDKDGNPVRRVTNTDPKANLLEYGTNDTPKFAVRAKVEAAFKKGKRG